MKRLLMASLFLVACGPGDRPDGNNPGVDGGVDAGLPQPDAPPAQDVSRVYAHSGRALYRMNAQTLAATSLGVMAGLPQDASLLDLAVDQNDRIVGISRDALWAINATNGAVTKIRDLPPEAQGFTSLSFIPGATANDPDILVAARSDGSVLRIDETTGATTLLGSYGTYNGQVVGSSGDLFGVRGLGIFATVNVGATASAPDYLATIDPVTWKATPLPQSTGYDQIFGLGYWGGKIYGFVDDGFEASTGRMIEINATTGTATLLSSGAVRWFGAGVATDAPILQ